MLITPMKLMDLLSVEVDVLQPKSSLNGFKLFMPLEWRKRLTLLLARIFRPVINAQDGQLFLSMPQK